MDTMAIEKAMELYPRLLEWLRKKVEAARIPVNELEWYYEPEINLNENENYLIRLASSLQNGTSSGMDKVIKFNAENNGFIKECICYGDVKKVTSPSQYSEWKDLYNALTDNGKNDNGAKVRKDKIKANKGNTDYLTSWEKYSQGLFDGARYLANGGEEEVKLLCHNPENDDDLSERIKKIKEFSDKKSDKKITGLGFALVCDWLKECGCRWLAKPDVHILKVYRVLHGKDEDEKIHNEETEAIKFMYEWAKEIKNHGIDDKITAYKLDKIIWLICTGEFYLHKNREIGRKTILDYIENLK